MVVLAAFNINDVNPYVEDNFEDTSYSRENPLEEGRLMQC